MHMKGFIALSLLICLSSCNKEPAACFEENCTSIEDGFLPKVAEEITFSNCSEDATSYSWDFGDDETSTKINPEHEYEKGGTYTVKLIADGKGGDQIITKSIEILSLDGVWEGYFKIGTTVFLLHFDIEQKNNTLNGSFELEDGTGKSKLQSSKVNDDVVSIKFSVNYNDTTSYIFQFSGNANSSYNRMEGDFKINGEEYGNWTAEKYSSKSLPIEPSGKENPDIQQLISTIR